VIAAILASDDFRKELTGDFMIHVADEDVSGILNDGMYCIAVKPKGVGQLPTAKKYSTWIKNKTTWLPWCLKFLVLLENEFPTEMAAIKLESQFVLSMGDFWPRCEKEMEKRQEEVKKSRKEQLDELEREKRLKETK
jgi:hypothetical protein